MAADEVKKLGRPVKPSPEGFDDYLRLKAPLETRSPFNAFSTPLVKNWATRLTNEARADKVECIALYELLTILIMRGTSRLISLCNEKQATGSPIHYQWPEPRLSRAE